jgi:hypothetical protein
VTKHNSVRSIGAVRLIAAKPTVPTVPDIATSGVMSMMESARVPRLKPDSRKPRPTHGVGTFGDLADRVRFLQKSDDSDRSNKRHDPNEYDLRRLLQRSWDIGTSEQRGRRDIQQHHGSENH